MTRLVSEIQAIVLRILKDELVVQILTSTIYSISDKRDDELDSVLVELARRTSSGPVFLVAFVSTRGEFDDFIEGCRYNRIWIDYEWLAMNSGDKFIYAVACKEMRP